jgi:hypothetical protein
MTQALATQGLALFLVSDILALLTGNFANSLFGPTVNVRGWDAQSRIQLVEAGADFLPERFAGLQQAKPFGKHFVRRQIPSFSDHALYKRRQVAWDFSSHGSIIVPILQMQVAWVDGYANILCAVGCGCNTGRIGPQGETRTRLTDRDRRG